MTHTTSNIAIDLEGERALVESHILAFARMKKDGEKFDCLTLARAIDRFERRDGAWRIAARRLVWEWNHDMAFNEGWARGLIAAAVLMAVGWAAVVYAANNSVQGAKKEEGGFDGDAPTAILIEASSGAVLYEKNADELRAPSSMMKLMTAETVFHAIQQGDVKLTDE